MYETQEKGRNERNRKNKNFCKRRNRRNIRIEEV